MPDAMGKLQDSFDIVLEWCSQNKLTLNTQKTKFTLFPRKDKQPNLPPIPCNNCHLDETENYVYLGVDIQNNLSMDLYVNSVCKKVNYKLYIFKKIRRYITTHAAILIYKQTILPYFDYGGFLMDNASQLALSAIDKYKKRALRIIEYKSYLYCAKSTNIFYHEYRIVHLRYRRNNQLLSFMFMMSGIKENINCRRPTMTLRNSNKIKFKEKLTVKTLIQKSPMYRGIHLWNELPEDIQRSDNLRKFKRAIRSP